MSQPSESPGELYRYLAEYGSDEVAHNYTRVDFGPAESFCEFARVRLRKCTYADDDACSVDEMQALHDKAVKRKRADQRGRGGVASTRWRRSAPAGRCFRALFLPLCMHGDCIQTAASLQRTQDASLLLRVPL